MYIYENENSGRQIAQKVSSTVTETNKLMNKRADKSNQKHSNYFGKRLNYVFLLL